MTPRRRHAVRFRRAQMQTARLRARANAACVSGAHETKRWLLWRMNWLYERLADYRRAGRHVETAGDDTRAARLAYLRTCSREDAEVGADFLRLTLADRLALSIARIEGSAG